MLGRFISATKFIKAAQEDNLIVVQRYIHTNKSKPHKINMRDSNGRTALIWAACKGHHRIVMVLLATSGIDVNIIDDENCNALTIALHFRYKYRSGPTYSLDDRPKYDPIIDALLKMDNIRTNYTSELRTDFFNTIQKGNIFKLQKYIAALAGVEDLANGLFNYALLFAAHYGQISIVRIFIDISGINLNYITPFGLTSGDSNALMHAILGGHESIAHLLIDTKKVNLNQINSDGDTALILAVRAKMVDVAEKLVREGADVTIVNKKKETAKSIINNNLTLKKIFASEDYYKGKLKLFFNELEENIDKKNASGETKAAALNISFWAAAESIRSIQNHVHKTEDIQPSSSVFFEFAQWVTILGVKCNEQHKEEFDKTAHQLLKIATLLGHEQAENIVRHFSDVMPTRVAERKESLSLSP